MLRALHSIIQVGLTLKHTPHSQIRFWISEWLCRRKNWQFGALNFTVIDLCEDVCIPSSLCPGRLRQDDDLRLHGEGHVQHEEQPHEILLPLPCPQDQEGHAEEGVNLGALQQGSEWMSFSDRYIFPIWLESFMTINSWYLDFIWLDSIRSSLPQQPLTQCLAWLKAFAYKESHVYGHFYFTNEQHN